jgi:hypothetical protein
MRLLLLLAALLSALPALAQISDADGAAIRQAVERGRLIYAYDQAAWHGTDDMLTKLKDPGQVGGWIVRGTADAPELTFFDRDTVEPHAVYVAQFRGTTLATSRVVSTSEDRSIDPSGRRMIDALATARKAIPASGIGSCVEKPFNSVVLPPTDPASPALVYFLTPQVDAATVPLGGHYLFEVGPDGSTGAPRRFSKACLPMAPPQREGTKPAAMVVSHLLDPTPTEIHVFTALTTRQPVYVMTQSNGRLWAVEGARIRLVETKRTPQK